MIALLPLLAALLCAVVVAWLLRVDASRIPLDLPNERSLHTRPVPRVGGLGIMAGALPALTMSGLPVVLAALALGLAAVSFLDDRRGLPIGVRFGAHFVAAGLAIALAFPGGIVPWWTPALAFALVWMTNLYNFMDGSDGLAGGMAVAGFGTYGAAALAGGDGAVAAGALGVAGAALAFLRFNFHPARVFMGDAGSIPLGFLAGALGLLGWVRGLWPWWFPAVAFGPFVADASVTLARRIARGERFWQAHRTHYYQRLVQLGWGHRRTALGAYALMAVSAAVALAVRSAPGAGIALTGLGLLYLVLGWQVDRAWRARGMATGG